MLLVVLACAPVAPSLVLPPDPSRTGAEGADGPHGAARMDVRVATRVSEGVGVTVVFPADDDAGPDTSSGVWPVVAVVQGGFVAPERYEWLGRHFASRGYVTLLADHPLDLAISAPSNTSAALAALRAEAPEPLDEAFVEDAPAAVMGHSLGGVIASWVYQDDPTFTGLALLASYPAEGDALDARDAPQVLSLVGDMDGATSLDDAREGAARYDAWYGEIDGMNHYAWTDDPTPGELAGDFEASRDASATRLDALHVLDTWLDATLRGDAAAAVRLSARQFPNVTATAR